MWRKFPQTWYDIFTFGFQQDTGTPESALRFRYVRFRLCVLIYSVLHANRKEKQDIYPLGDKMWRRKEFTYLSLNLCMLCNSSSSEIHFLFPFLKLQRRHLRWRRELVPLWVRPRVRRTGLPHQWVPGNWRVEGVRWAGGVRGERPGKREPIVWGRQIRKPFRKTGLTSCLSAESRSELRFVRRVSALSRGPLGETLREKPFQDQSVIQLKRFRPNSYKPFVQRTSLWIPSLKTLECNIQICQSTAKVKLEGEINASKTCVKCLNKDEKSDRSAPEKLIRVFLFMHRNVSATFSKQSCCPFVSLHGV